MAERILGPQGSKRRRRFLWAPTLVVTAVALFLITSAQAVHGLGVFQLDGNVLTSVNSNPTASDDWDRVCYQNAIAPTASGGLGLSTGDATTLCTASAPTTGATAVAWAAEPNKNSTIFTGGGSKDPTNLSGWAWKDGAGGLPDKDNLEHAMAVRYTATSSNCGGSLTSCDVIYFGSDRFDNSGDAQQGFWFLQNPVQTTCTIKQGGGTGFCDDSGTTAAQHKCGDLLVISDFANGGTHQIINAYKWVDSSAGCTGYPGDVSTNLRLLAGTDPKTGNADCSVAQANDAFCGTISSGGEATAWPFLDKSGNSDTYLQGELFEAGINLSSPQINLGGECFATVVSETRSSTSPTATLKDFVTSHFGACTSGTRTGQVWLPNDSSTTTVTGKSIWTGTVTFKLWDGGDCGTTHADGSAYAVGDTYLYTEGPTTVSNTTPSASTTNTSVKVPTAAGLTQDANNNYIVSWSAAFDSGTSGVPDSSRCEATTMGINDNVSHT